VANALRLSLPYVAKFRRPVQGGGALQSRPHCCPA
jgi:hypothetical protein